jgi:cytoskeletal protein CcmA (bactofilin family)
MLQVTRYKKMFKPKKEEQILSPDSETIVGESVKLEGNIDSQENVSIFGQVVGKIKTGKNAKVGERAEIKGDLEGENVFVAGRVEGNIVAKEKLEISSSGKVFGDIQAKSISIAPGAVFSGNCQMEQELKTQNYSLKLKIF